MLRINDITLRYRAAVAVERASLTVPAGKAVCLLGPNGAGKSTILRAISGLLVPSEGSIEFDGTVINGRDPADIVRMGISQVPEGRSVFPDLTVKENLLLGTLTSPRHSVRTLLDSAFAQFPVLERKQRDPAGLLSGGEQQMLAIARALMAKPRLFVLDEPSLGLAPKIVAEIFRILDEVRRAGTTILIAEQDAATVLKLADYGYVLQVGHITLEGSAEELRNDDVVQRTYFAEL